MLILLHIGFIPPRIIEKKTPNDFGMDYQELDVYGKKQKNIYMVYCHTEVIALNYYYAWLG